MATAIHILSLLAVIALGCIPLVILNKESLDRGQDAAGRGMAVGCFSILFLITAFVFGAASAIVAMVAPAGMLTTGTQVIAFGPVVIVLLVVLIFAVSMKVDAIRRDARRRAERMAIPVVLLADIDANISPLYEAFRSADRFTQVQTFLNANSLFHQLSDFAQRAKLISINGDMPDPAPGTPFPVTLSDLYKELVYHKPACPILIYSKDVEAAKVAAGRLLKAKLAVNFLESAGEGGDAAWIGSRWLSEMQRLYPAPAGPVPTE